MDTEDTSSSNVMEDESSLLKDSPSKKEQSLKEQLEEDWAEEDSQDTNDVTTSKDSAAEEMDDDGGTPNPSSSDVVSLLEPDPQSEYSTVTSLEDIVGLSVENTVQSVGLAVNAAVESVGLDVENAIDSVGLGVDNTVDAVGLAVETSNEMPDSEKDGKTTYNNSLDAALGVMDPSTDDAAFENIIDSALAVATAGAPSMPDLSSDSQPLPETTDTAENPSEEAEKSKETEDEDDSKVEDAEKPNESKESEKGGGPKMRMHLTSEMMQKLLKEGNMEKLPNGSYKIKAEALKELQEKSKQKDGDEDEDEEDEEDEDVEDEDDDEDEEDEDEQQELRENDDQDKKQNESAKVIKQTKEHQQEEEEEEEEDDDDMAEEENSSSKPEERNDVSRDELMDTSEADGLNEESFLNTELSNTTNKRPGEFTDDKPNRKNKKSKFDVDYVSDYNSSEDDDESAFSLLRENIRSMIPRKGKYQTKGISFLEEVHSHLFPKDGESDDSLSSLSDSDDPSKSEFIVNGTKPTKKLCPGTSSIEAKLGIEGSTSLKIIATGEVKEVQGKEFEVYHINTTTDWSTTTSPLMIPKSTPKDGSSQKPKKGEIMLYHQPHVKVEPDDPNLLEELEEKKVQLRKYKQQLKILRLRYLQLVQERLSKPGFNTLADLVNASSKFMSDEQVLFTTMQLKSGCLNTQGMRWSPREKILALGIYQQNPSYYDFLRQTFNLPNKSVLEKWLDCIAKNNPMHAKKLMYHIYTKYAYKAI